MAAKEDSVVLAPPVLRFRLPPDPARLLRARERIRDYLSHYCAEQNTIEDVLLCIEEALTNVIRHSCADDDLEIGLGFEGDDLVCVVRDRGCGFDVESFDPTATPDVDGEGGRGLFLMAALADDLQLHSNGGLEVRLTKQAVMRCDDRPPDTGLEAGLSARHYPARRSRTLLEDIGENFIALDWDYRCVYLNPSAVRLLGAPPEELLFTRFWDLYPVASGSSLGDAVRAAMELGHSSIIEHDASEGGWHEVRVYPTTTGVSLFARGIDDRKRIEAEREQLLARTSLLRDVALAAASSLDLEEICSAALHAIHEHVGLVAGNVWILDQEDDLLLQVASCGYPADAAAETKLVALDDQTSAAARVMRENLRRLTHRTPNAPEETTRRASALGAESWLTLPIGHGRTKLGCISLLFAGQHRFDKREIDVYQSIAGTLGTALANGHLHQAQSESEERFRSLFETMSQSASLNELVVDEHGTPCDVRFLMVNPAFEQQTGLKAADVVGHTAHEIFHVDQPAWLGRYREVVSTGAPAHFEERFGPLGLWLEVWAYRTGQNRFAVLSSDISERKRAEEALQASEERLRLAVGAGNIGLYEWRSSDDTTYWNDEMYRLMGLEPGGQVDMETWLACVHPDDHSARTQSFVEAMQADQEGASLHDAYRVVHANGDVRWIEAFSAVERRNGDLVIHGAARDITERKLVEEERERSFTALQQSVLSTFSDRPGRWPTSTGPGWAWLILPVAAVAIVALKALGLHQFSNTPDLFTALNVAFLTAIPLLIAVLAAHSYLLDGSPTLLFLGCGTLILAIGALLAPMQVGGPGANGIVTVYNTAALLAALCYLTGVSLPSRSARRPSVWLLLLGYAVAVAVVLLVCVLSRLHMWPTYFVPEIGATAIDWVVLYMAAAGFALTALILYLRPDGDSPFYGWYALGLALIAAGLVSVSLQLMLGDPLNWTGRVLQYLGCVCMLLAVLPSLHQGSRGIPLGRALREASDRYRALVDVSPEAILVVADDRVVFANPAALGMLATESGEDLLGERFSGLLDTKGRPDVAGMGGEDSGPAPGDVRLRRLDGRLVDVELRSAAVQFGGLPAIQYVANDVSDRRASEQERERLRQLELETQRTIATTLQENLIHPLPAIPGWQLAVATQPASADALVGGDFHDAFPVSPNHLAVLLGDVEGKGIPAAGLTETVRSASRALALSAASPTFVLERLNALLFHDESQLVTALFMNIQRGSGMFAIASAGHPAPLHLHADDRVEPLAIVPGTPLGAFRNTGYTLSTGQMEQGDFVVLFTDGVTDARRDGRFFGEDGVVGAVRDCGRASAAEIAARLRDAVREFADELRDDVHILVIGRDRAAPRTAGSRSTR
jgi:phosphoserine phosphatase RsbU/P